MPAPNDLTPEEEQAFVQHGVQPSGPGMEPVVEGPQDIQDRGAAPTPHSDRQPAETPATPAQEPNNDASTGTITVVRGPDGRFIPAPKGTEAPAADPNAQPPVVEPPAGDPNAQPPQGFVPHAALHAERMRATQAIQQAQLLQTRMNAILSARTGPEGQGQQPQALPDLATDPVAYIQNLESRLARFEQVNEQETQFRQIDNSLEQDEQLFASSVPDYEQASEHYVNSRARELLAFNTPEQAQDILRQEVREIARQAWSRGMPAAQMIYTLAQARGYAPGQASPAAQPQTPAPPTPQPSVNRGPAPAAVVSSVHAAQAASRSLSGGTGAATPTQLNAEAILSMSDEEFEAALGLGGKNANSRFAAIAGQ